MSWNSELPSGHNPFWIRDDALAGLGLHPGDAVAVDTRGDPRDGDLVVAEVQLDDDSVRVARRYVRASDDRVRLEPVGANLETITVDENALMVMGVIVGRVRIQNGEAAEEPL